MTSMYAPAQGSMYMQAGSAMMPQPGPSMVETVGAPVVYAQPSYVPPPQIVEYAQPSMMMSQPSLVVSGLQTPAGQLPAFAAPAPKSLTVGLPEPAKVEAEKAAYEKALDAQLKKQADALAEEANLKKKMMEQTAKMQIAQFTLQVEEKLKMDSMQVDAEAQTMMRGLEEAAIIQKTSMQERAALTMADYVKRKAIEDCNMKAYNVQKQYYEAEAKLMAQYQQAKQAGAKAVVTGGPQVPVGAGI